VRFICDPEVEVCVQCLDSDHCDAGEYCMYQTCLPVHCTPGETLCFGSSVMRCLEDGGSTVLLERCDAACEMGESGAECVDPADTTGGSGSSPGNTTSGATTGATSGETSGATTGATSAQDVESIRSGCECRLTPSREGFAPSLLLVVAGLTRRRRR
jgi:hypothetical protein